MPIELPMIRFLSKLPQRERLFYMFMRSYDRDLTSLINKSTDNAAVLELSDLYESSIIYLLDVIPPVCNNQVIKVESPHIDSDDTKHIKLRIKHKADDNDEFADKIGKWASPFSSSDDEPDKNPQIKS